MESNRSACQAVLRALHCCVPMPDFFANLTSPYTFILASAQKGKKKFKKNNNEENKRFSPASSQGCSQLSKLYAADNAPALHLPLSITNKGLHILLDILEALLPESFH